MEAGRARCIPGLARCGLPLSKRRKILHLDRRASRRNLDRCRGNQPELQSKQLPTWIESRGSASSGDLRGPASRAGPGEFEFHVPEQHMNRKLAWASLLPTVSCIRCERAPPNLPIWTPPASSSDDLFSGIEEHLQSYIRHLKWEHRVPCRHGICNTRVPIATNDRRTARRVTGIIECGGEPSCHDG